MPPSPNLERRRALADAAIEVLGRSGVHALSHRAVDTLAALPAGTASNYFRSRDALLLAAAERVVELHEADMAAAIDPLDAPVGQEELAALIGASLHYSATAQRTRYLAIYELTLEATRRPDLCDAFATMNELVLDFTARQHRALGLTTTRDQVRTLVALFGGALFTLVTGPPEAATPAAAHALARTIVAGAQ